MSETQKQTPVEIIPADDLNAAEVMSAIPDPMDEWCNQFNDWEPQNDSDTSSWQFASHVAFDVSRSLYNENLNHNNQEDLDRVARLLGAAADMEDRADMSVLESLFAYRSDESIDCLQALYSQKHPALIRMLDRSVRQASSEGWVGPVNLIEQIVSPTHRFMMDWKNIPADEQPDFMRDIIARSDYKESCYESEIRRLDQLGHNRLVHLTVARDVERRVLDEIYGVDPGLSRDFRLAIIARTALKDKDDRVLMPFDGGGIDEPEWRATMHSFVTAVESLGVDNINRLYKHCGIVNVDRYTTDQLRRMVAFIDRDPMLLDTLKKSDVAMVITDQFGDHNGALATVKDYDDDDKTLFFESGAMGLYRWPISIARSYGIRASTLVIGTHGQVGTMGFGDLYDPDSVGFMSFTGKGHHYDVRDLRIGRLLRDYMKPSSKTGERHVILYACLQAARNEHHTRGTRRNNAESIVMMTDPKDRVAVTAADKSIWVRRQGRDLNFYYKADDGEIKLANVLTYRHMSPGAVRVAIGTKVPGL